MPDQKIQQLKEQIPEQADFSVEQKEQLEPGVEKKEKPAEGLDEGEKYKKEKIERAKEDEIKQPKIQTQAIQQQDKDIIDASLVNNIENILQDGLNDIYLNLSNEDKEKFKIKGEEASNKIAVLINEAKVKVKKIIQAIIDWLRIIPKISKFFIKQTAKIKTDKILKLRNKNK